MMKKTYTGEDNRWLSFNNKIIIYRDDKPYLIRRTLINIYKWFSLKYHKIYQSDGECSHDHPWSFLTIILSGGYYEYTPKTQKDSGVFVRELNGIDGTKEICRWHKPGSIMFRPARWKHRLELKDNTPAKTFVITFPVVREWGFFTKWGWIFWENYNEKRDC